LFTASDWWLAAVVACTWLGVDCCCFFGAAALVCLWAVAALCFVVLARTGL
jgi:hypothetical protein